MKTVISVASVLACAFSLDAQIIATLNRLPDDLDELRIRNNSATSLVVFVVTVNQTPLSDAGPLSDAAGNAPFVIYSDPLIDPAATPLLPSEERVVMVSHIRIRQGLDASGRPVDKPVRVLQEPIVTAGIFADGVTTGDAALLTRLRFRRSNMLMTVETMLETLSDAGRHNVSRDQLIKQLRVIADSMNRSYLSAEQQVGRVLYKSIIGKLMNLPEGEIGSAFPPSAFIAEETAMLNRQRVTLLESQPSLTDSAFIEKQIPSAPVFRRPRIADRKSR